MGTPQALSAVIWHSPARPLKPIKVPIRKDRGREKIRIPGIIVAAMDRITVRETFLLIKSSERFPRYWKKSTNVRTSNAIKNGGKMFLNMSLFRIFIAAPRLAQL